MSFFKKLKGRFTTPEASVSLTTPKNTFELGEDLKGAIVVSSQEEFDATEVRAELRCVEKKKREKREYDERRRRKVRRVYWDTATLHSVDPRASGAMHLTRGFNKTFPFSVNIPAGGRESFDSVDGGVTWSIKGVVAIDGRPDVTSETVELQVIRPAAAPTVVKEIVKEVVMIPCEYCGTLTPQTATSCPNCGATRKA
ncbi:MAG: hypothetical protein OEX77_09900 [Candidatus Bathyarchaeota archaeon]|nr:hypothetical protein [Candidatus Bathyarchaeota archaeon]